FPTVGLSSVLFPGALGNFKSSESSASIEQDRIPKCWRALVKTVCRVLVRNSFTEYVEPLKPALALQTEAFKSKLLNRTNELPAVLLLRLDKTLENKCLSSMPRLHVINPSGTLIYLASQQTNSRKERNSSATLATVSLAWPADCIWASTSFILLVTDSWTDSWILTRSLYSDIVLFVKCCMMSADMLAGGAQLMKKKVKSMQASMTPKFRSKDIQSKIKALNQASSPLKPSITSIKTIKKICTSESNINKVTRNILTEEEQSDNDIYVAPVASCSSSSSVHSLQLKSSFACSELVAAEKALINTIKKIENNPRLYLGVPNSCYFLIDLLKDDYGISPSNLSKIFIKNIPLIAKFLRPFVVELDKDMIKK
ncbi:hypothetical protein HW555_013570, partial [Spodoptera exigua]